MDDELRDGEYVGPEGERVRVNHCWGWWSCVVVSPDGKRITPRRLRPEYWRVLRQTSAPAV